MTRAWGTRRPATLARVYLRWLVSLCLSLTLVILAAVLGWVMLPMAERSADDLAGLMVLSAQTWAELPPDTRPAFEAELLREHQIALRTDPPATAEAELVHGFYVGFVERALQRRSGAQGGLTLAAGPQGDDWLWARINTGEQTMGVGYAPERMSTRPLWVLAVALLAAAALATAAALWLARRIALPVARLEQAAAVLAAGAKPALLPQTGPRELADLAGHFNQMTLRLRELLEARTTLLAGISHDLRTPLARMRLALEMLTLQPKPELIARLTQDIDEMNTLIGQLLTLARGLDHEAPQNLALAPWLAQRLDLQAAAAAAAGATLTVDCAADATVHAAAGALARVLDNLLGNALRYAPGPVCVQVVQGTAGTRINVLDRGPGIPPGQLEAVWRPFQRVEASRSPQTGGWGLGLAIVRQLAQAQGWQAGLAAREGGGLVSWVELPAAA